MSDSEHLQPESGDDLGAHRVRDDHLIVALLRGDSYAATAEAAGCSVSTVQRRLADPAFAARLDAERRDQFDRGTAGLLAHVGIARSTLVRIATNEEAPATAQVAAARTILQEARAYADAAVIETRIAALGQAFGRGPLR